ncbi:hypothetical protein PVAP13_2KG004401 [Panicum virgatum]|uniref:Uncharacterized protein n=1 Tax=Panicum virgatum TaxID=38727 RepID=A0A8T0W0S3_PANVG|nr:hypothetical protein PVAP13_2KG004401 [Panicum virgatum]
MRRRRRPHPPDLGETSREGAVELRGWAGRDTASAPCHSCATPLLARSCSPPLLRRHSGPSRPWTRLASSFVTSCSPSKEGGGPYSATTASVRARELELRRRSRRECERRGGGGAEEVAAGARASEGRRGANEGGSRRRGADDGGWPSSSIMESESCFRLEFSVQTKGKMELSVCEYLEVDTCNARRVFLRRDDNELSCQPTAQRLTEVYCAGGRRCAPSLSGRLAGDSSWGGSVWEETPDAWQ